MTAEWESVCEDALDTRRMHVPGGWLYKTKVVCWVENGSVPDAPAVAIAFVPDPPRKDERR